MLVKGNDQPETPTIDDVNRRVEEEEAAARRQATVNAPPAGADLSNYGRVTYYSNTPTTDTTTIDADSNIITNKTTITQNERAIIRKDFNETKRRIAAERAARRDEDNRILDSMGLMDAYGDTIVRNRNIYAKPVRLGAWER